MDTPVYLLIVAAGSGLRMGAPLPKQFAMLESRPVLWHTLQAARQVADLQIILVLPQDLAAREHWQALKKDFGQPDFWQEAVGGDTRTASVRVGLALIPDHAFVLVHDGVRCLIEPHQILACLAPLAQVPACTLAVPVQDSLRFVAAADPGQTQAIPDRSRYYLVQTPQAFAPGVLQASFQHLAAQSSLLPYTDEASLAEAAGYPVTIVEGNYENIKLTTPVDMLLAQAILRRRVVHLEALVVNPGTA